MRVISAISKQPIKDFVACTIKKAIDYRFSPNTYNQTALILLEVWPVIDK